LLLKYDSDKLIPTFGFGGIPKFENLSSKNVEHCFPINGIEKDPNIYGIENLMSEY
jgi:hypothetical protein